MSVGFDMQQPFFREIVARSSLLLTAAHQLLYDNYIGNFIYQSTCKKLVSEWVFEFAHDIWSGILMGSDNFVSRYSSQLTRFSDP